MSERTAHVERSPRGVAVPVGSRPTCCWTNCDNEQGLGTWLEITTSSGPYTLPVCEEHWFGNWHRDRRQLRAENERLRAVVDESDDHLRTRLADAFVASGWAGSLVHRGNFRSREDYERALNAYALDLAAVALAEVRPSAARLSVDGGEATTP